MTSSLLNPVMATALRFHSLTRPPASMPKMGALAVSMSMRKSFATWESSLCDRVNSETSCPTPTTPIVLPSLPKRGVTLSITSTRSPSLRKSGKVNDSEGWPSSAPSSTSCTFSRYSSLIYRRTRSWPMTSSLLYPVSCAALRFHSLIWPLMSMPKIGAFA